MEQAQFDEAAVQEAIAEAPVTEAGKKATKPKTEVTAVTMADGRVVGFAGKRKMLKSISIGPGGDSATVQFDFRNGETRTFNVSMNAILFQLAAHGASQKIGDAAAGEEDLDDMVVAIDDVIARLNQGEWGAERAAGDGFAGASSVIRAIMEVNGKTQEEVKAFLQKKLDTAKEKGEKLSRADLYAAFRKPGTKTGDIVERLEREKKAKAITINSDDLLAEME